MHLKVKAGVMNQFICFYMLFHNIKYKNNRSLNLYTSFLKNKFWIQKGTSWQQFFAAALTCIAFSQDYKQVIRG